VTLTKTGAGPSGAKATNSDSDGLIVVDGLTKGYGTGAPAVDNFSLSIGKGEVVALLGPSGCGKTTTLRSIAGLIKPDAGTISIGNQTVYSSASKTFVQPDRRGLSMVFQQYALWPHMTVFENVAFGLRARRENKSTIQEWTKRALEQVELWDFRDRRIAALSGGQQQRIALARAIAVRPNVVLFDEPLSNLDTRLREQMRIEILELQRQLGFSAIYVTHDQHEAIGLARRVVIMNGGRVEQVGSPHEVWNNPQSAFVARFIGSTNRVSGTVSEITQHGVTVRTNDDLDIVVSKDQFRKDGAAAVGDRVDLYVKMSDVAISAEKSAAATNTWAGEITLASFDGDSTVLRVSIGNQQLLARVGATSFSEGAKVTVRVGPEAVACFFVPATTPSNS
jgi:ABC-type Fe3+/spermidine/putrescine transport system ATPase subunit